MKKILLLLSIFLLVGCANNKALYKTITYEEVKELSSSSEVIIIDVRSGIEYEANHIENAINIPVDTINKDVLKDIIESLESNIVVYCRSGARSKQATELLINLGYTSVYDFGSIDNWEGEDEY